MIFAARMMDALTYSWLGGARGCFVALLRMILVPSFRRRMCMIVQKSRALNGKTGGEHACNEKVHTKCKSGLYLRACVRGYPSDFCPLSDDLDISAVLEETVVLRHACIVLEEGMYALR